LKFTSNVTNHFLCPWCAKGRLLTDHNSGEQFCESCGFVVVERLEGEGPEWRVFGPEDYNNLTRTGLSNSLAIHDRGLATIIDPANRDAYGKPLSSPIRGAIERLRIWDSRSRTHTPLDRNLRQAFGEIDALKYKLALSDAIIEKTAYIYRKALELGLMRGRSISAVAAASLYAACRDMETTRTLNEISDTTNVKRNDVARCYRVLLRELDLKIPVVDPIKCVGRIASKCNLNEKIKRVAVQILKDAEKMEIMAGKDPMGLAAAALYLSCIMNGENKNQKDVAQAAGVTEVTVRNRYRALEKSLGLVDR
jgi:transcription initiation factor TFIIB